MTPAGKKGADLFGFGYVVKEFILEGQKFAKLDEIQLELIRKLLFRHRGEEGFLTILASSWFQRQVLASKLPENISVHDDNYTVVWIAGVPSINNFGNKKSELGLPLLYQVAWNTANNKAWVKAFITEQLAA